MTFQVTLYNAETDVALATDNDGVVVFERPVDGKGNAVPLNIAVAPELGPQAPAVGSVRLELLDASGDVVTARTENVFPYALFGDRNGDFFSGFIQAGSYTLRATVFSEANGRGDAIGGPADIELRLVDPSEGDGPTASLDMTPFQDPSFGLSSDNPFVVVYTDADGVDSDSLGDDDIVIERIDGGPSQTLPVSFFPFQPVPDDETEVAVVYSLFDAPVRGSQDNGTYQVRFTEGAVRDSGGAANEEQILGTFTIDLDVVSLGLKQPNQIGPQFADTFFTSGLEDTPERVLEFDVEALPLAPVASLFGNGLPSGQPIAGFQLTLTGPNGTETTNDVTEPYSLFGEFERDTVINGQDRTITSFNKEVLTPGDYVFSATPFTASGPVEEETVTARFTVIDAAGPTAALEAPLAADGTLGAIGSSLFFEVVFEDPLGVKTVSLGQTDLELVRTDPGLEQTFPVFFSAIVESDPIGLFPKTVKAEYGLLDIFFDNSKDNGTYELRLKPNEVFDGKDTGNDAQILETFKVDAPVFNVWAVDAETDKAFFFDVAREDQIIAFDPNAKISFAAYAFGNTLPDGTPDGAPIDEVRVTLSDADGVVASRVERVEPYALFGDTKGDFNGRTLDAGEYTLELTPFADGVAFATQTTTFTLVEEELLT